jgi:hypothetical protein
MAMRTYMLFPAMALFISGVPAQQNETNSVTAHVNTSSLRGPKTEVVGVPTLDTRPEMQRLSTFLGRWAITYELDPTADMPSGGQGEERNRTGIERSGATV